MTDPDVASRGPTRCSPTPGWPRRNAARPALVKSRHRRGAAAGAGRRDRPRGGGRRRDRRPAGHAASLRPVINATGVIVHTNLGRAPLSRRRASTAVVTAGGATDVEFDLAGGQRARRGRGALAALAAAVPAARRRARGQQQRRRAAAVRAGPGARPGDHRQPRRAGRDRRRLPDAGAADVHGVPAPRGGHDEPQRPARLRRRDRPGDRLHPQGAPVELLVTGFTSAVGVAELATLGRPVVVDIGSGLLRPHPLLPDEPDAATALRDGADAGHRERRQAARRAAGRTVARRRRAGGTAAPAPGRPRAAGGQADARRAGGDPDRAAAAGGRGAAARTSTGCGPGRNGSSRGCPARRRSTASRRVGGGGAPGVELPSAAVSLPEPAPPRCAPADRRWSAGSKVGRCLLDLRTVAPDDDELLVRAVLACTSSPPPGTSTTASRRWCTGSPACGPTAGRGAAARPDDRAGLRLDRLMGSRSRSSTCPATSRSSRTCSPGWARCPRDVRRRRHRGLDAAVRGAPRRLDALGVRHALLVISKADLADPPPRRSKLGKSFRAPRWPIPRWLRTDLDRARGVGGARERRPPPDLEADVRLWVDRSFTVRGAARGHRHVAAGTLRVGDELDTPGGASPSAGCSPWREHEVGAVPASR